MNQRKWKGLVCSSTCLFLPLAILPQVNEDGEITTIASWYGPGFHGRKTASGERFNQNALTAASRTLPFGTRVKVRNPKNGKTCTVTINDRGPFVKGRGIDLSRAAAKSLGIDGIAKVCYATVPKYEPKPSVDLDETPKVPVAGNELEVVATSGVGESIETPVAAVKPSGVKLSNVKPLIEKSETRQESEPFHAQIESLRSQLRSAETLATARASKAQEPQTAMLRASQFIEAPQFTDLVPVAQNGQLRAQSTSKRLTTHVVINEPVVSKPAVKVAANPSTKGTLAKKQAMRTIAKKQTTRTIAKKQTARAIAYSRAPKKNSRAKRGQYIAQHRYKSKFGRSMDKLTARASHIYKGLKGIFAML